MSSLARGLLYWRIRKHKMNNFFSIILTLAMLAPATAAAQQRLSGLQQSRTRLETHRGRLEVRLGNQAVRIRRLKAQPAGVRRDYQLRSALKANQELSGKLSRLQNRLNDLSRQMVKAYAAAISRTSDPARRARLVQRRTDLQKRLRGKKDSRVVTTERANPLDSPEDLEEKADLLEDSREKVKRQLNRVRRQLTLLKKRVRLRRHARAADHNPFDEGSAGRTSRARAAAKTSSAGDKTRVPAPQAADDANKQNGAWNQPPSGKHGGGSYTGNPGPPSTLGGSPTKGTDTEAASGANDGTRSTPATGLSSGGSAGPGVAPSLTLKDIMDPSVLKELRRSASRGKNIKARIKLLRMAQQRLDRMSTTIGTRATKLRKKAKSLRGKK